MALTGFYCGDVQSYEALIINIFSKRKKSYVSYESSP